MVCYGLTESGSTLFYFNLKHPLKTWQSKMVKKEFESKITAIELKHNMIFVALDNSKICIYQVSSDDLSE